ncbi:MAG: hypothetical protein KAI47_26605 [Deltaproteobacteria bacterium]|nr:hypothetical protein [Deltaproteobacteria bacterium]
MRGSDRGCGGGVALEARRRATQLETQAAGDVVRVAEAAARDARKIVDDRNHAYTFHTTPSFSFGEGWYLVAAAFDIDILN